ncbi:protein FAM210B, mitochondrial-like [Argiope bruennichi]|uniref:Protein FAM210B like protein n=1 Tax=Argiope bruennichi TaxID=94029 RepID=A0A8T0EYP6_ARGBR|nr:protein FAM210B, mitochondrial-like [Argiope bruennichi]KAF8781758.1 Protein FAM210B like protein [Argiope bruennichi]
MTSLTPIRFSGRILCYFSLSRGCMNYAPARNFIGRSYLYKCNWKLIPALNASNSCRLYSNESKPDSSSTQKEQTVLQESNASKVNQRTRLKQAVRDYGATIIVFHVAISLTSLGLCYLAISNGVDVVRILTYIGFSDSLISSKVAVGGSTFVVSYAVHKLFAPVRIGITLSVAPFIVRYLRRINWLKPPKSKS